MKNFLLGTGVGTIIGYMFHRDIDRAIRQGLAKANEATAEPTEPTVTAP